MAATCRVITPKIGENRNKQTTSILFSNILDRVKDVTKATKLYQVAYSSSFIKEFGNWVKSPMNLRDKLDTNGEPQFKYLDEYLNKISFNLRSTRALDYFKSRYQVDKQIDKSTAELLTSKLNRLYPNINAHWEGMSNETAVVKISFKDDLYIPNLSTGLLSKNLVDRMLDKFPKLSIQYISTQEIPSIISPEIVRSKGGVDNINAFYKSGKVYLVEGKATDDIVVEEFVHPFVEAISQDNPQLLATLFKDAKVVYPSLWTNIQREYSKDRGFSEADRAKELVTQSIAKSTINEYEFNEEMSKNKFLESLERFWNALRSLISDLISTDSNKVFARDINPTETKIEDIARLLNVKGLTFETAFTDPFDVYFSLTSTEAKPIPEYDIPGDLYEKVYAKVENYVGRLKDRKKFFEDLQSSRRGKFAPQRTTIDRLEYLIAEFGNSLEEAKLSTSKGTLIQAYSKMLDEISLETERISKYVNNKSNIKTDPYISVVLEGLNVIESYKSIGLAVDMGISNSNTDSVLKMVLAEDKLDTLKDDLQAAIDNFMIELVKDKTTNKNLTVDDIQRILKEAYDIDSADYFLGDVSTSTDTLLAIADKIFKDAQQETFDRHDKFQSEVRRVGNKLASLYKGSKNKMYDFMLVRDDEGNLTGRYLQKIGYQYWKKYYDVRNPLYNKDGSKKEYIKIDDLKTASSEDIAYNLDLRDKKRRYREFVQPEYIDNGAVYDGSYKKYNDEYKQERNKYMYFSGMGWEVRPEYENSTAYSLFLNKYYNDPVEVLVSRANGTTYTTSMRFVKSEYTEIRDISSTGQDMRDSKWIKLQNPTNELEKAQLDFYNFFVESFEGENGALNKLPQEVMNNMIGKIPRVRMKLFDTITAKREGFIQTLSKSIRGWFRPDEYSTQRLTDETGMISDGLPVFYTGDLQSRKRIESLEAKQKELKEQLANRSISYTEYSKKNTEIRRLLNIEHSKVRPEELDTDLATSLVKFSQMAENYEVMSNIEDTIRAIGHTIETRKVFVKDKKGNILTRLGSKTEPVLAEGRDSLVYKRFTKWTRMVFYNNDEVDNSTVAIVAKRLQNTTSLLGMGFNPFAAVNNYVMGRINNSIEGFGGILYDRQALTRSNKLFNKEYIPGLFRELGHEKSDKSAYKDNVSYSKYSALIKHFRIIRKLASGDFRADSELTDWAYMMQEGGEFNVQSKTGIAVLMTEKLKHKETGEESSVYDAYDFDSTTQTLKLKPGFELSSPEKHGLTNKIYEVNKQIHGNYAQEDRMVIQQHWLGQLGAQFHKWVYPAYKARFKKRYFDENLGYLEGRYTTIAKFFTYAFHQGWNFKNAYNTMDQLQKKNMRKNVAELGFFMASYAMWGIFTALAAGVPDEDKNLKKFMNFLIYQQTRQMNEIRTLIPIVGSDEQWQLAKSPLASLKTVTDFGDAVWTTVSIPYDVMSDNYYFKKGPNKDEARWWKEWQDVIPGLKQMNRWDAFETVKNFYIR